jgi:hypothetical protein
VQQLRSVSGRWQHINNLLYNHSLLTADEYESPTSWLNAADLSLGGVPALDNHEPKPAAIRSFPPRILWGDSAMPQGHLVRQSSDGQSELEHIPDKDVQEQSIAHNLDKELARHRCQTRAVFPFTVDGMITHDVECLPFLASSELSARAELARI